MSLIISHLEISLTANTFNYCGLFINNFIDLHNNITIRAKTMFFSVIDLISIIFMCFLPYPLSAINKKSVRIIVYHHI